MSETGVALALAAFALLGSPGPAPLALSAVSASYGLRRGLPFLGGILAGLSVSLTVAGIGLTGLMHTAPIAVKALAIGGFLYILYIAYKIAASLSPSDPQFESQAPPGFFDGLIINSTNPKALAVFTALYSNFQFQSLPPVGSMILEATIIVIVAVVVDIAWFAFGSAIGRLFAAPLWGRLVRIAFAAMMVGAVIWALSALFN